MRCFMNINFDPFMNTNFNPSVKDLIFSNYRLLDEKEYRDKERSVTWRKLI